MQNYNPTMYNIIDTLRHVMGDIKWSEAYKTFKGTNLVYYHVNDGKGHVQKYLNYEDSLKAYSDHSKLSLPIASTLFACFVFMDGNGQGYGRPTMKELRINRDNMYDLIGKNVIFTAKCEKFDTLEFDEGMKAQIINVYQDEEKTSFCIEFNMVNFLEHNVKVMKPTYYDKDRKPTLKWIDTIHYPKNHIEDYWFSEDDDLPFLIDMP